MTGDIFRVFVIVESGENQPWQVTVKPHPPNEGWAAPPEFPLTRTLLKKEFGIHSYPCVDPDTQNGLPEPEAPHYSLCTGKDIQTLDTLYTRISSRKPDSINKDISMYGKYLFDTLLGRKIWKSIIDMVVQQEASVLDLALSWEVDEIDLHRLNWEMMHGPDNFLAARQTNAPKEIAITRLVKDTAFNIQEKKEIPRYLFAIGAPLDDNRIRPGAEFLGLLRQVEAEHSAIHTRVLRGRQASGASPKEIEKAVEEFKPHVVHFTCHGTFDEFGNAHLELGLDPGEQEAAKYRDTQQIFQYLNRKDQELPLAVVLSACNTGQSGETEMKGAHETAPMASQLVKFGIPIVVGMAGKVADSACRYFTRQFSQALVNGESLIQAASSGRRAAFAYGQSPEASVDWALPALFVSDKMPVDFIPFPTDEEDTGYFSENLIDSYNLQKTPVFCGRYEFFDEFYRLFEQSPPGVLVAYVESKNKDKPGFGKSRLLEEFTRQAIRDGNIPVPIIKPENKNQNYPENLEDLRRRLIRQLDSVTENYNLAEIPSWSLRLMSPTDNEGHIDISQPEFSNYTYLKNELNDNMRKLTGRALALALRIDLSALTARVRNEKKYVRERNGRSVLLLDDIQQFGMEFLQSWFNGNTLGNFGLGRGFGRNIPDEESLIPVVMTVTLIDSADQILNPMIQNPTGSDWVRLLPLTEFPKENDLDILIYEQIWLNPFDAEGKILEHISNRPFARQPLPAEELENWKAWAKALRVTSTRPIDLKSDTFYCITNLGVQYKFLAAADDEDRLNEYMKGKQ